MQKIKLVTMVALALGLGIGCSDNDHEDGTERLTTAIEQMDETRSDAAAGSSTTAAAAGQDAEVDYHDGEWWVNGVQATDGECAAESDCYAMWHEHSGWMFHQADEPHPEMP